MESTDLTCVLQAVAAPLATMNPEGVITAVNESWSRFMTATAGRNHRDVWPAAADNVERVLRGELNEFAFDDWCSAAQSNCLVVIRTARPLMDGAIVTLVPAGESGKNAVWRHTASAGAALTAADERFRLVADATSDVIWDWAIDADHLWWSEGLKTQFGYTEPISHSLQFWLDNVHPDDVDRVKASFDKAVASFQRWREEYRFRRADGTYAIVIDRGQFARDRSGRAYRAVGAMVDVTGQRELQSRLERVQRVASLGQLAANMAHEFNNVLMGIQPFVEVISRATPDLSKVQSAAARITQSVNRGKKVTGEILLFTRDIEPVRRPLNVREWLLGFQPEASALAGDICQVEIRPPAEDVEISADAAQLNQVLINLLINGRDASSRGGRLIIAAKTVAGENGAPLVEISVQDFGVGMDSALLTQIFEPLFTTKKNGTGLGLSISQQVVMKHGGTMSVESEMGTGTTFFIRLPLPSQRRASPASALTSNPRDAGLPATVLIVDDDPAVADGISMLVAAEGLEGIIVHEGGAATPAIERFQPQAVLLDVGLPDMSGIEVFEQIHRRWPRLPVVLISGHHSPAELGTILSLPHVAFVQKPFEADEILNVLRRCHSAASAP